MLSKSVTAKLAALLLLSDSSDQLRVLHLVKVCSRAVLLCVASAHP
jgi:hypothetical protein